MNSRINIEAEHVPALRRELHQWMETKGEAFYTDMIQVGLQPVRPAGPPAAVAAQLATYETARLREADLWYLDHGLCQLLAVARNTMPRFAPKPHDLPSRHGFCVFAEPIYVREHLEDMIPGHLADVHNGEAVHIRAVSWGPVFLPDKIDKAPIGAVWMSFYAQFSGGNDPGLPPMIIDNEAVVPWHPDGEPESGWLLPEPSSEETTHGWAAAVFAAFRLATQAGLTEQETQRTNRPERRRTQRDGLPPRDVRIARLRTSDGHSSHPTGQTGHEYRHQWIVRGHWRNQRCGSRGQDRRPIWIAPHLKGPDGAPLIGGDRVTVVDAPQQPDHDQTDEKGHE